jgi:hypothetical protein
VRGCTVYFVAKLSGAAITLWLISSACVMLCDEQRRSTFAQNVPGVCVCVRVETLGLRFKGFLAFLYSLVCGCVSVCICYTFTSRVSACLLLGKSKCVCSSLGTALFLTTPFKVNF